MLYSQLDLNCEVQLALEAAVSISLDKPAANKQGMHEECDISTADEAKVCLTYTWRNISYKHKSHVQIDLDKYR